MRKKNLSGATLPWDAFSPFSSSEEAVFMVSINVWLRILSRKSHPTPPPLCELSTEPDIKMYYYYYYCHYTYLLLYMYSISIIKSYFIKTCFFFNLFVMYCNNIILMVYIFFDFFRTVWKTECVPNVKVHYPRMFHISTAGFVLFFLL